MSFLNKNRKQNDLALAFLRSNGNCVYCNVPYDLTFEFEHVYADKNDKKALLACSLCNRHKATKTLLDFVRGNVERASYIENLVSIEFSQSEIDNAIRYIANLTVEITYNANRCLTISDLRFITTPKGRINSLPVGLKIDATERELNLFSKVYDTSNLDIYIIARE